MIQQFVDRFVANRAGLASALAKEHPNDYIDLVRAVVRVLASPESDDLEAWPDPQRVVEVDHGGYQGTLVYVIGAAGYQPGNYWATYVDYGSCSGCDTLQAIRGYEDAAPTPDQIDEYMILVLHLVQRLVAIC